MTAGPFKIAVVQCIAGLDDAALRYLLLSANARQRMFEFEFVPLDEDDSLVRYLRSGKRLSRDLLKAELAGFPRRYHEFLTWQAEAFDIRHEEPRGFLVISTASCSDNYIRTHQNETSVLTLGDWRRWMAPPSILEFIYAMALRSALQIGGHQVRNHLGTRGCLFDFGGDLADVRQMVLAGRICHSCKAELESSGAGAHVADLAEALSREWLKTGSEPGSPASIIRKLGHDLFTVKDLKPSATEQVRGVFAQEGVKQALAIAGSVIAASLILAFGLKAEGSKAPAGGPAPSPAVSGR